MMSIYLAGGIEGNLAPKWSRFIKSQNDMYVCLAGEGQKQKMLINAYQKQKNEESMNVYLAGEHPVKNGIDMRRFLLGESDKISDITPPILSSDISILESYYYLRNNEKFCPLIPMFANFLLDSGAFTFMNGAGKVDWDKYVEEYAAFINKWDIKRFFELDIDVFVGLNEVERLRAKLEKLTGKKPIVVWHISRGKEKFLESLEKYDYVALGGLVKNRVLSQYIPETAFPWFINEAHKRGVKIHGLGYTKVPNLKKYHFDSVDSTAWLAGNRGGFLYKFNPRELKMEQIKRGEGFRLKSSQAAAYNFYEWAKLCKYAKENL